MGRNKEGTVCNGKAINDMPRSWYSESEYNKRVYVVWCNMINRCYSEKWHEKYPIYKDCYCCERWLTLSNFVEDVCKIDGYKYWLNHPNERVALDKDIKSNGQHKEYSLENCMFVSASENTRQANKSRIGEKSPMYDVHRYGEKSPNHRKIVSVDPLTKQIVFTFKYIKQATDFYSIDRSTLKYYLKGKSRKGHEYNGFLWYYADEYEQMKEDE